MLGREQGLGRVGRVGPVVRDAAEEGPRERGACSRIARGFGAEEEAQVALRATGAAESRQLRGSGRCVAAELAGFRRGTARPAASAASESHGRREVVQRPGAAQSRPTHELRGGPRSPLSAGRPSSPPPRRRAVRGRACRRSASRTASSIQPASLALRRRAAARSAADPTSCDAARGSCRAQRHDQRCPTRASCRCVASSESASASASVRRPAPASASSSSFRPRGSGASRRTASASSYRPVIRSARACRKRASLPAGRVPALDQPGRRRARPAAASPSSSWQRPSARQRSSAEIVRAVGQGHPAERRRPPPGTGPAAPARALGARSPRPRTCCAGWRDHERLGPGDDLAPEVAWPRRCGRRARPSGPTWPAGWCCTSRCSTRSRRAAGGEAARSGPTRAGASLARLPRPREPGLALVLEQILDDGVGDGRRPWPSGCSGW